jgi:hypothetical protein
MLGTDLQFRLSLLLLVASPAVREGRIHLRICTSVEVTDAQHAADWSSNHKQISVAAWC